MKIKLIIKIAILAIIIFLTYDRIVASSLSLFLQKVIILFIVALIEFVLFIYDFIMFSYFYKKLKSYYSDVYNKIESNSDEIFTSTRKAEIEVILKKCIALKYCASKNKIIKIENIKKYFSRQKEETKYKFLSNLKI